MLTFLTLIHHHKGNPTWIFLGPCIGLTFRQKIGHYVEVALDKTENYCLWKVYKVSSLIRNPKRDNICLFGRCFLSSFYFVYFHEISYVILMHWNCSSTRWHHQLVFIRRYGYCISVFSKNNGRRFNGELSSASAIHMSRILRDKEKSPP